MESLHGYRVRVGGEGAISEELTEIRITSFS
jgi:hypothetical protein